MSRKRPHSSPSHGQPRLEILVDGKASVFRKAERAYVRVTISSASTDQSQAFENAQSTVTTLTSQIRLLATKMEDGVTPHPSAAVTAFTVSPLSTFSRFQRDDRGNLLERKPKEHTVSTSAEIIFRNMERLAEISAELATMQHLSITGTEWRLTEPTRLEIEREARIKAIKDAVQKAEDFAGVVARRVVAVEIKDGASSGPGHTSHYPMRQMQMAQMQQQQQAQMMAQHGMSGDGMAVTSDGPALEPKTITVSASVSAKFVSIDGYDEDDMEIAG
ncbi:hypothetical protein GE09DRAFT_231027 [Coniochaeta sp. 2T2.1]|nr:hypothetical protein GE09DRAFT_231027 [Coniochaeta sp. 2T2.1]